MVFICNSMVGEKKVLLTYNNIINNINCVHKVFLNLKCVLNVLTQNIFQDWMNLSKVLQLLSSCWEWNVRTWALLKSWEEKRASSSEEVRMIVQTIQGIDVKINIPEIFWNVFWQMMNSRLYFYIMMLYEKYSMSALLRVKPIKLSLWTKKVSVIL